MSRVSCINTPNASKPILSSTGAMPYSHCTVAAGLIFLTGQVGLPASDPTAIVRGGAYAETTEALKNVAAILAAAGSDLEHVLRCEVYLMDLDRDFDGFNKAWIEAFAEHRPASAVMQIAGLGMGACVEIVCTAAVMSRGAVNSHMA
ncbi:polymerase suppressor [Geranomyces variabilis]|uniref:Polymerase suppressor n=1 Tax=Geranomyces variabilis TaxID=109894 RepID=A0AAD5XPJ8_9FUNG|nr:polymerase suppressor [Geranomyces variabilis]